MSEKVIYLKPNDVDVIVKRVGDHEEYEYDKEKGWIRSGFMLEYYLPESDNFDNFAEISYEEALRYIG